MCVAVPMQILEIDENTSTGRAQYFGNEMSVNLSLVSAKPGDYALVHAGCAIEILKKDIAMEILDIFSELEEIASEP